MTEAATLRVAVVTGASAGIGLAVATEFARGGLAVAVNARHEERLGRAARSLEAYGQPVLEIAEDVTAPGAAERIVARTLDRFGRADVLVNNAGGGTDERWIEAIGDDDWTATLDLNLRAAFSLCRAVVPAMRGAGYGRIVNMASVAGRDRGRLSGPQYTAAKAGLLGLTRHLAWDLAEDGVTVNAVAPGFVMTERALAKWRRRSEAEREAMLVGVPMHRFARPEEVSAAVAFLASEGASYITGACLDVNGGSFMC